MEPNAVQSFLEQLQNGGLTFLAEGNSVDIAVVDQQNGLTVECEWLEVARVGFDDTGSVMAAWLWDKPRIAHGVHMAEGGIDLHTPPGWNFEGSLSQKFTFVPNEDAEERLRFVRSEDGVDVFEDIETGKEFYVATDNPTHE